jgi:hypothetical protein
MKKVFGMIAVIYTSPVWGELLLEEMGELVNRDVLGESGIVSSIKPFAIIEKTSPFENALSYSGGAMWLLSSMPHLTPLAFFNVIYGLVTFSTPYINSWNKVKLD